MFHDIPLSANMSRDQLMAEIDVDTNLDIAGSFSDEDLLNEAKRRRRNNPEFSEDEEESGDEEPEINLILALKVIRKYAQKSNMSTEIMSLRNIERKIIVEKTVRRNKLKLLHTFHKFIHTGTT